MSTIIRVIYNGYMYYTHIKHGLGCLGGLIIGCSSLQVLLVLLTVHVLMDSLALDAVHLVADGAVEAVHLVPAEAESLAVGGLAVVAVGVCTLCFPQALLVQLLQLLRCYHLREMGQRPEWKVEGTCTPLAGVLAVYLRS